MTGSEGFVGRAFHRAFEGQGHVIHAIDLKSGIDALDFFAGTESNRHFDLVIHLAALVGGRVQIEQGPFTLAARDLALDAALFRWAVESGQTCPIVYFSSSAAYPIALQSRMWNLTLHEWDIDLDDIRQPDMSYGWTKLTGEQLARWASTEHGIDVRVFRPFSGYGSDQDLDYPFPSFIARGLRRDNPFVVWGDGTQTRDFIHIDDVVAGVLAALDADYQGPLNLASGVPTSFTALANMVMSAAGYDTTIEYHDGAPTGVHTRVADITRMSAIYTPRIDLQEGIARAMKEMA